jgi:UDP-N-acetylmuramoyl-L-alanyl-D-glutamate--2,6-diaminopimelate ligase
MKELENILKELKVTRICGDEKKLITGVTADSREVQPGSLFIAVRGTKSDGHAFIGIAIELGAIAVICEKLPEDLSGKKPVSPGESTVNSRSVSPHESTPESRTGSRTG